jgi:subfamily B ATP-binding cassette protein MsbA
LISAVLIWYGGYQVMEGVTTPGELAAFFLYALIIAGPIGTFVRLYTQMQEALGAIRRVYEILDTPPLIKSPENAVVLSEMKGSIEFDHVNFEYNDGAKVVDDVSFQIQQGQTVALVGPSGAGKSTLIKLLLRFFDPKSGTIRVDGNDIRDLDLKALLQQIALVPQETLLFGGTVKDNILYGRLEATDEEVIEAAKSANAHNFIAKMENGYDTVVGEKGVKLSGGERQRVAIARALLKDPCVLVLDEATSSLDNESESLIQEAMERLMVNRTTFIIAHRLSTIHNSDLIIVLDHGKVVETGKHEELMQNQGLYHKLYTIKMLEPKSPASVESF